MPLIGPECASSFVWAGRQVVSEHDEGWRLRRPNYPSSISLIASANGMASSFEAFASSQARIDSSSSCASSSSEYRSIPRRTAVLLPLSSTTNCSLFVLIGPDYNKLIITCSHWLVAAIAPTPFGPIWRDSLPLRMYSEENPSGWPLAKQTVEHHHRARRILSCPG